MLKQKLDVLLSCTLVKSWYTVVDEMSVDEMSVECRRSVVDEMSVDELSWNQIITLVWHGNSLTDRWAGGWMGELDID